MIEMSQIAAYLVPSIVILCYLVGYIFKSVIPSERVDKFIPLVVSIVGVSAAILVAVGAGAPITLDIILGGLCSGLASTGIDQVFKQLTTKEEYVTIPKGEDTTQFAAQATVDDTEDYVSKHMKSE